MKHLTEYEHILASQGNYTVRFNLLTSSTYSPYCGANLSIKCSMPRMRFNGTQFVCPECGEVTQFPEDFITYYKNKWNK